MKENVLKIFKISLGVVFILGFATLLYTVALPKIVNNNFIINSVEKIVHKATNCNLKLTNPKLSTGFSPYLEFKLDGLVLEGKSGTILQIDKVDTKISFEKIFKKQLVLKKAGVDNFYLNTNKINEIKLPQTQKNQKKSDFFIDLYNSELYIKKCKIEYSPLKNSNIEIFGKDFSITQERNPKHLHFKFFVKITAPNGEKISFSGWDNDKIYAKDNKLFIDNFRFRINKSKVYINSIMSHKDTDIKIETEDFDVVNIAEIIKSNLIIPNGSDLLSCFDDIYGKFDFKLSIKNDNINGNIKFKNSGLKLIYLNNMPVYINNGTAYIAKDNIKLANFNGYYGNTKENSITFEGDVKNYTVLPDIKIQAKGRATNDLAKNYLSKVVGFPLELTGGMVNGKADIFSIGNKTNINWGMLFKKGQDVLVGGTSLTPATYERALAGELELIDTNLNIKNIDYYISNEIKEDMIIKPLLTVHANMDIITLALHNLGFTIPKPLPSEFLNVFIGQKMFKKGTIAGSFEYDNRQTQPKLNADFVVSKVFIPSQRLYIREAKFTSDDNLVKLASSGRYKRSQYSLDGSLQNKMKFPFIIKSVNLNIDDIDVEKILESFNKQNTQEVAGVSAQDIEKNNKNEEDNDAVTFDTNLLVVENCELGVNKGKYKDINFGNIKANLTLDKNGLLSVKSNRFDFAEGISSLKVLCDLKNHKYSIKLGAKEINSDILATTLLQLPKEISGLGSGLIELNTDDTMKLNGKIKFDIKDGTIQKIGLIEYVLNFASLFRNPMAMISPSTFVDMVNIPEGKFDRIWGDIAIENNVIEKIIIKSTAPQLSSFIAGRFDMEKHDATLRIYTKFSNKNKGLAGFMRNISLNSLANRIPLNSQNENNYHQAELKLLPPIEADEKDCQVFLTKVDGDVEHNNFISSLKKLK